MKIEITYFVLTILTLAACNDNKTGTEVINDNKTGTEVI